MKKAAQIISYLLHPLLMPVYVLFFIFNTDTIFSLIPSEIRIYCYLMTFFALFILPLASLPVFRRFHLIGDYGLNDKQERVYPILVAIAFAFLSFWLIGKFPYTNIVRQLYLVLIIILSGFSIITIRWKMSMHMTSIGAACGFLLVLGMKYQGDVRYIFMVMLLLSGLLGSSRLYLEKHSQLQLYAGFFFGLCFVIAILV